MKRLRQARRGFSLVELLVVVTMIVFLLALALPAILRANVAAQQEDTKKRLFEVIRATHLAYEEEGGLPPAYGAYGRLKSASLHVHILPFAGEKKLYEKILAKGVKDFADEEVATFLSSDDPSNQDGKAKGVQNFAANLRVFSDRAREVPSDKDVNDLKGEHKNSLLLVTFPNGTSNTIMFATKYAVSGDGGSRYAAEPSSKFAAFFGQHAAKKAPDPAAATAAYQLNPGPKQSRSSPLMAQSFSDKGLIVGMADGQVRFVLPKIDPRVWNTIVHPEDRKGFRFRDAFEEEKAPPAPLPKWEYRVMTEGDLLKLGKDNLASGLNRLGDESWQLVGFGAGQYIFKRQK